MIENRSMFVEMLNLQNLLNTQTCWENWTDWITNKWRTINWRRCIVLESAEAIESFNWKHWKDINWSNDEENIKIEIVDIWHFIMSYLIEQEKDDSKIIDNVLNAFNFVEENIKKWWILVHNNELRMKTFEELMKSSLSDIQDDIYLIVKNFFEVMFHNWMNLNELYKIYIVKNTLNRFRQENGYKEWTYIKMWNWVEDNSVAMILMNEWMKNSEELFKELTVEYQKVLNSNNNN